MKRFLTLLFALLTLASVVSGCDFMRRLAGRPTSADIEAKRQKLATRTDEHAARMDSLSVVQQQFADSLAKAETQQAQEEVKKVEPEKPVVVPGETVEDMSTRYAVTLAAFSKYKDAKALCDKAREAGYDARLIHRKQYISVAVVLTNDRSEAVAVKKKVEKEKFHYNSAIIEK